MDFLKRLLQQLHERSLWQITALYAGFAYAILQATDLFIERLQLPSWLFLANLVVLIAALPLIWITAFVTHSASAGERVASARKFRVAGARRLLTWRNVLGSVVLCFAFIGAASLGSRTMAAFSGAERRWVYAEGLPRLERLVEEGKVDSAWVLGERIAACMPDDSVFLSLRGTYTRRPALFSVPPGAQVSWAWYAGEDTTWHEAGTTPVDSALVPNAFLRWRFKRPGSTPLLLGRPPARLSGTAVVLRPDTAESPAFVHVNGGDPASSPAVGEFLIGKYEVTNAEFREFVDAAGYARPEYWPHPVLLDGRVVAWKEAMGRFTDASGLPGPSTWVGGSYPDGQADFPVGGISWYEAAAYAAFRGLSLPSYHHWIAAAQFSDTWAYIPLSNLNSAGPRAVTESRAVGAFGTYDIAGNVREWLQNEGVEEARPGWRYIMGAAWPDPGYLANSSYLQPPWDRSATNGARLARYLDDTDIAAASAPITLRRRDYSVEQPVSDDAYAAFAGVFKYDTLPLAPRTEATEVARDWVRQRISFDAAYGKERMVAYVYFPARGERPYHAVIIFPGDDAFRSDSVPRPGILMTALLRSGRAVIYPVYKGMHERKSGIRAATPRNTVLYRDHVVMWVKDLSRTVDYLQTRSDMNISRLGFVGLSLGGRLAPVMAATEPRLRIAILALGGLGLEPERELPEADPLNHAPRVQIPVLMLNGRFDSVRPVDASVRPALELLGTAPPHKRLLLYESAHFIPQADLVRESLAWLDRYTARPAP